jgi:methylenetetrahydrofolate reductase (NADPH)
VDLVKFIREEEKDYFGICVAGYPNGHPDCTSFDEDLVYLKEKIDAGADFVITQLFFESQTFISFVERCIGIKCPIIPGVLPIQSYASLRHLMKLSKIRPPDHIINELEAKKDDDAAIRSFGVSYATKMCRELLESKCTWGFHFYTLNRETAVIEILQNLSMWNPSMTVKEKPWLTSANQKRAGESIRPIFWSGRPKSYLMVLYYSSFNVSL